jgi:hypothetical protein
VGKTASSQSTGHLTSAQLPPGSYKQSHSGGSSGRGVVQLTATSYRHPAPKCLAGRHIQPGPASFSHLQLRLTVKQVHGGSCPKVLHCMANSMPPARPRPHHQRQRQDQSVMYRRVKNNRPDAADYSWAFSALTPSLGQLDNLTIRCPYATLAGLALAARPVGVWQASAGRHGTYGNDRRAEAATPGSHF